MGAGFRTGLTVAYSQVEAIRSAQIPDHVEDDVERMYEAIDSHARDSTRAKKMRTILRQSGVRSSTFTAYSPSSSSSECKAFSPYASSASASCNVR